VKADAPLARRIYVALLHLYPAEFRRCYATELTLLFVDMHRAAAAQGMRASVSLWLTVLLDLLSSATRERIRTMVNPKWAAVISLILLVPTAVFFSIDLFNYEPRFVQQFFILLFTSEDHSNTYGRIFEIYLIMSAPIAFAINLLSLLRKTDSKQTAPFLATRSHTIIGLFTLVVVLIIFSKAVLFPLPLLGPELGDASILGQGLCLLVFLPLPAAFLLGRLPRFTKAGSAGALMFQPTSLNLIIGAALLLVLLLEISGFMLEATACSVGIPNCD
jgi:hypothetical protein